LISRKVSVKKATRGIEAIPPGYPEIFRFAHTFR
jgi:hypothetical protein